MFFLCFNNHVVNTYLQVSSYLMGKNHVHESLVCGASVLETEGHGIVVVIAMVRHEGSYGHI